MANQPEYKSGGLTQSRVVISVRFINHTDSKFGRVLPLECGRISGMRLTGATSTEPLVPASSRLCSDFHCNHG